MKFDAVSGTRSRKSSAAMVPLKPPERVNVATGLAGFGVKSSSSSGGVEGPLSKQVASAAPI